MSPLRGRRKRKENSDLQVYSAEKKRIKSNGVNGIADDSDDVDDVIHNGCPVKENGVQDSHLSEKENLKSSLKTSINGSVNESEIKNDLEPTEEPLQSFHAKFTKTENSVQNEQCNGNKHVHTCFACKIKDDNVVKCSVMNCDKFYHSKCLEKLPTSKVESNACPLHLCLSCYNINPKNPQISKGKMYKCFKCPTAFHAKDECTIPGSVILTHEVMSCPDHFSPERQREYPAVMNLLFCVQCGCNTDLLFCEFCPFSIHKHCIKDGTFMAGRYVCSRCETRKILFYNDIVWAKICNFRWWPARILNPKDVPTDVQKIKHFEGEFPVQFFETGEYFWTQKGRVFPFTFKNIGFEDADISHNFKKQMQDIVFDGAISEARQAVKDKTYSKQIEAVNNKKPPPYKHIKSNRPVGEVQIYTLTDVNDYTMCGCQPEDPNPCGYGTLCLNRSMCTECLADVCEAGNRCQNQKFQKREYAAVKPFCTVNRGWGLKCLEDIKEGHFIIEYVGDLIDERECERRIEEKQACGDNNFYFCILDSTRIIDAGPKGNYSRFLNHSCEPNCETQKWIVNGDARVGIFAKKDIPAGSELTFDYQMDFSHFEKLKCNCGSQRCSGLIGKKPQNGISNSFKISKEITDSKLNNKNPESDISKKEKGKPVCFKCKKGGKLITCTQISCQKLFHLRCITNTVSSKPSSKNWECPLHFCKKCKLSAEYQCYICPNAYCKKHVDNSLIERKNFTCPKHSKSG